MDNYADNKFTWVIKNFSSLGFVQISSEVFVAGRCKWHLLANPRGDLKNDFKFFSLHICVPTSESLPYGWRRHAKVSFTIVNQTRGELSQLQGMYTGFLVNGEVKIVAEVDVLEVIGKFDVPKAPKFIDIKGFKVPAYQVESVKNLFRRYPGFAKLSPKNPHLRSKYLNVVLSLDENLCKSCKVLSNGDLADAYSKLRYVTKAGFKLDWLENKLKAIGKTRLQNIENELKNW